MSEGPLYLRLTAVVLGTLFLFAVLVVVIHTLAIGHATEPLRLEALRVAADAAARDLAEGRRPLLAEPFAFAVVAPSGDLVDGSLPPWRVRFDALRGPPGERCAHRGAPCWAMRLVGDGARLVVYPRLARSSGLWGAASLAFFGTVVAWLAVSALAGLVLLRSLRRADESRRRLLAGLAHDLGTPLTSIRGFAETRLTGPSEPGRRSEPRGGRGGLARACADGVARRPEDDPPEMTRLTGPSESGGRREPGPSEPDDRRVWTVVYREALRMQRLIEDMLALTRLEAGRLAIVPRPFDLREVLQAAAERAALAHGDAPRLDLPDTPAVAEADRDRIDQVVANLADNAYRHGAGRDVHLALTRASDGGSWRITVSDGGPGLAPEARAHLYEPFRPWGSGRGSGLGLAIAREIVARHGGVLRVEDGPGCRVVVELPAAGPPGARR